MSDAIVPGISMQAQMRKIGPIRIDLYILMEITYGNDIAALIMNVSS